MSRRRRFATAAVALVAVIAVVGAAYFAIPQPNLPEASAALASTDTVTFARVDDRLEFRPASVEPITGLILYPGGRVDAAAYAPTAARLAGLGFLVVIVPMPLNLAVLGIDRADAVLAAHPEIRQWAIGGHSLGGAMAAQYVASHPNAGADPATGIGGIRGLVLWAAYSASRLPAPVATIVVYGTLDSGAAGYVSAERLANLGLPPTIVTIEGGNHEQMGWYTGQPNDPPATISRAAQQDQLIEATARFLGGLEP
ncbi:MAG TPA: alpha/beta hydrolase [Candidatus Limnocylindrales bacterium]|nr:alpha/beta hydrolase [Candidatus Limnocylindrales bacterium]